MELTQLISEAYREDIPKGDVTTDGLLDKARPGFAKLIAKEDLVLSGSEIVSACFRYQTIDAEIKWQFKDGDTVVAGQTVALIHGPLASLLKAERVALNFLGHLSGIATYTKCFVRETQGTRTKILDTRKTTPLYRDLEKRAVVDGGGVNHRMNLSSAVLVKDNHKMMVGGLRKAVEILKTKTDLPIVVEVENLDEVKEAVSLNVNRILLDNMSDDLLKQALTLIPSYIETEVSGGVTVDRVSRLAKMGVTYISVGAITHSAPCADFSLLFERSTNV